MVEVVVQNERVEAAVEVVLINTFLMNSIELNGLARERLQRGRLKKFFELLKRAAC